MVMVADAMTMDGLRPGNIDLRPLLAGLSALVLLLGVGGLYAAVRNNGAVARLQVQGSFKHVHPELVRAVAAAQISEGFLAADIDQLRVQLERLPWVEHARVERVWPADLRIRIWEREPFARWGDKGLLSTQAVAFEPDPKDLPGNLPQLSGPPGHESEVMETYKRILPRLAQTPFPLGRLVMNARGEWLAYTPGGIELRLGQGQPDAKLDIVTGPMVRALAQRVQEVNYVDLRYTNGFAVAWHTPGDAAGEKK